MANKIVFKAREGRKNSFEGKLAKQLNEDTVENKQSKVEKYYPTMMDKMIPIEDIILAPKDWNIFTEPDKKTYNLIKEDIRRRGQLDAIRVWERPDGKYMCLGGHTRLKIFYELRLETGDSYYDTIKSHVYGETQITEIDAQEIVLLDNSVQRAKEDNKVLAKLVSRYKEIFKLRGPKITGVHRESVVEQIADRMNVSTATVDRFIVFTKVDQRFLSLSDDDKLPQWVIVGMAKLSPELQSYIIDNKLYEKKIDRVRLKELAMATTTDQVDKIYGSSMKYEFTGNKVILDYRIPKAYKKISIAIDENDLKALTNAIEKISDIDDKRKKMLLDMIGRQI